MKAGEADMSRSLIALTIVLFFSLATVHGQSYRATVNKGNEHYHSGEYDEARNSYTKAADTDPERPESFFNAGNAAYRSDDIEAALELYEKAGVRVRDRELLSNTLYNAGNTFLHAAETGAENPLLREAAGEQAGDLRQEGYKQAIELYKKALKSNPRHDDARYNLTYAKNKLEELQNEKQDQDKDDQQEQQKQQEKDQDQEQEEQDRQDDQQQQDKQDDQQQQQQDSPGEDQKEKGRQDEQQQAQPQEEPKISKQQAEQILRALQREEKELQRQKRQQQGRRVQVERDW
jgi:Ca-activated chloride channel homolog